MWKDATIATSYVTDSMCADRFASGTVGTLQSVVGGRNQLPGKGNIARPSHVFSVDGLRVQSLILRGIYICHEPRTIRMENRRCCGCCWNRSCRAATRAGGR